MSETPAPLIPPVGEDDLISSWRIIAARKWDWHDQNLVVRPLVDQLIAALTLTRQQHAEKEISADMVAAQLRGWQDFFSGQPSDLPYDGSEVTAAKETQMNFAWRLGYDAARESILYNLMVGRADRSAERSQALSRQLAETESSVAALRAELATPCVWTEDRDGQWDTACGHKWEFISDGPTENHMHFCHNCGHPVTAVHYVDTLADDDEQDEQEKGTTTP